MNLYQGNSKTTSSCVCWLHLFVVCQLLMRFFFLIRVSAVPLQTSSLWVSKCDNFVCTQLEKPATNVYWGYWLWQCKDMSRVHFVLHLEQYNLSADGECVTRLIRCNSYAAELKVTIKLPFGCCFMCNINININTTCMQREPTPCVPHTLCQRICDSCFYSTLSEMHHLQPSGLHNDDTVLWKSFYLFF